MPPPTSLRSPEDSLRAHAQLRPTFAHRRRDDYRKPNSGERPVPRRRVPAPVRGVLAGADERPTLPPPTSPRSLEDSLRIRVQLRPTFARRRRDYYRQPNSGEKGAHRRKATAPVRVVLAGAGERPILPPPTSARSWEHSLCIHAQLRPAFARRRKDYYRKRNSGERPVHLRKAPVPVRFVLAGAGERTILSPPTSLRSSVDSLRIRAQLRPTFSHRRTYSYRNRNSGERPVPRRKAPAPVRFVLTGAGEWPRLPPPTSPCSSEDSLHVRAQLRQAFARRRRDYYWKPNSGEKPVPRRKAPPPVRFVLAGAGERPILSPPPSARSSVDSIGMRAQLRPTFARRRTDYYRKPNSGEKPVPRRKAPAPVRVVFAGAGESNHPPSPPSPCSSEDSLRIRPQLRPAFSHRRKSNYRHPNSGERPVRRRNAPPLVRFVLARAGERTLLSPPTSACSSEDSLRIRAQLRPAFARRRKMITGNRNSGEGDTHRKTLVTPNR